MKEHKYIIMKNIYKNEKPKYCLIDYYEDKIKRFFNDLSSAKMYLEGLEEENGNTL